MSEALINPTWLTRRGVLKGGAAAAAVGAWGLSARLGLAAIPTEFDGKAFKLAAAEPNPKSGGVLRVGIPNRPPHFDIHQSGTIFNLGAQGCMFDNLIRHDPRDSGKTIIPDWRTAGKSPRTAKPTPFSCARMCSSTTAPN